MNTENNNRNENCNDKVCLALNVFCGYLAVILLSADNTVMRFMTQNVAYTDSMTDVTRSATGMMIWIASIFVQAIILIADFVLACSLWRIWCVALMLVIASSAGVVIYTENLYYLYNYTMAVIVVLVGTLYSYIFWTYGWTDKAKEIIKDEVLEFADEIRKYKE